MQEALAHVGHRQTRNRGTIGGSLCQLDPSAELPMSRQVEVTTPDVAAFRAHAQKVYLASDEAKTWPAGMLDQINAMK